MSREQLLQENGDVLHKQVVDMDMSGFRNGAIYEQIKVYALDHSGLKISSLYGAQVEQELHNSVVLLDIC